MVNVKISGKKMIHRKVKSFEGKDLGKIESITETDGGTVPVVCTPSGGAQSVRVNLPKDWETMEEQQLLQAIETAK